MAADDEQPNLLFLFTDQQRYDWIGPKTDVPVHTPNIADLADRGVQFTNAVCPTPLCNPSRACLASGYEYDRCGVPENSVDYPLDQPTLYGRLRDEGGYHVMGCGKFDYQTYFPLGMSGNHRIERWGFSDGLFNPAKNNTVRRIVADPNREPRDPYTAYLDEQGLLENHVQDYLRRDREGIETGRNEESMWTATFPTTLPDEAYYDNWITRNGIDLLEQAPDDDPWFLEVDFQNPHNPWDITEEMYQWYRDSDVDLPDAVDPDPYISPETHAEVRRNYSAMVEQLDRCVGRFVDRLEERGELENTVIVFSSDHGEMLGDHGQWRKESPLQPSVGVPLVVAGPDIASGEVRDDPATILDLHATFLEYAGIEPPDDIDSRSMVRWLADRTTNHRDAVYSGLSSWRMVFDGQYKLIEGYDPALRYGVNHEPSYVAPTVAARRQRERETILYDVHENERDNVADAHPDVVEALSSELERFQDGSA